MKVTLKKVLQLIGFVQKAQSCFISKCSTIHTKNKQSESWKTKKLFYKKVLPYVQYAVYHIGNSKNKSLFWSGSLCLSEPGTFCERLSRVFHGGPGLHGSRVKFPDDCYSTELMETWQHPPYNGALPKRQTERDWCLVWYRCIKLIWSNRFWRMQFDCIFGVEPIKPYWL